MVSSLYLKVIIDNRFGAQFWPLFLTFIFIHSLYIISPYWCPAGAGADGIHTRMFK